MTRREITGHSYRVGDRVEGGVFGSQDYDTGRVTWVGEGAKGNMVTVAWDSKVATTVHVSTIRDAGTRGA